MMKKVLTALFAVVLTTALSAPVFAQTAPDGAGQKSSQQQKSKQSKKRRGSGQTLSKRNQWKLDQEKQRKARYDEIMKERSSAGK